MSVTRRAFLRGAAALAALTAAGISVPAAVLRKPELVEYGNYFCVSEQARIHLDEEGVPVIEDLKRDLKKSLELGISKDGTTMVPDSIQYFVSAPSTIRPYTTVGAKCYAYKN